MKWRERPVILIGHGARIAGAACAPLLDIGIPILTSWNAKDLVDNTHGMYFGSSGVYGQRMANNVLYHADQVIALGNRLSIWNTGYDGIRPDQELWMCDCDAKEVAKTKHAIHIHQDLAKFIAAVADERVDREAWWAQCDAWRTQYPLVESPAHDEIHGYVNTYRFMQRLEPMLARDETIVVDAGTFMAAAFQVLRVKPPQRMITTGGLGEMGFAVPTAIGASFALDKRRVVVLVGDGGMMLNLQELQTVVHHKLPLKIIVFSNDGYTMIKHSQRALGYQSAGVNEATGLSTPSFVRIGNAFGLSTISINEVDEGAMRWALNSDGPALLEVFCHPMQPAVPKLNPVRNADGTISNARFCDLEPRL